VALKVQRPFQSRRRLADEVWLNGELRTTPGILPVLGTSNIASTRSDINPLWIAMEIATPLTDYLGPTPELSAAVRAIRCYSEVLADLADRGIYHRDIKPPNLYWLEDQFVIGDFGIADFPQKIWLD
jgi:serine/threonine protein kinase